MRVVIAEDQVLLREGLVALLRENEVEVVAELVRARGSGEGSPLQSLSPRELEVLSLMGEGRTNAAIAQAIVVTPGAVEKHISNIFSKLDLPVTDDDHRRVLAVLIFLQASGER